MTVKKILCTLLVVVALAACAEPPAERWGKQYDLGAQYLLESNYEQALTAFTNAIEIDPAQVEAYIGRGDVYVAMAQSGAGTAAETVTHYEDARADYEQALSLMEMEQELFVKLADVYAALGDDDALDELVQRAVDTLGAPGRGGWLDQYGYTLTDDGRVVHNLIARGLTEDLFRFEEITLYGNPIEQLDIWTAKSLLEQQNFGESGRPHLPIEIKNYTGHDYYFSANSSDVGDWAYVHATQDIDETILTNFGFSELSEAANGWLATGLRDIVMGDSMETVMTKLGFSNAAEQAEYLTGLCETYDDLGAAYYDTEVFAPVSCHRNYTDVLPEELTALFWSPETGQPALHFEFENGFRLEFVFGSNASLEFEDQLVDVDIWYPL